MKQFARFVVFATVGTFGFFCWTFWAAYTRARPPRRYEHWSFRLMTWAEDLWGDEEEKADDEGL